MSQSLISSDSSHQVSAAGPYASCCRAVAAAGELYPRHEKQTKKPAETTGTDIKLEF